MRFFGADPDLHVLSLAEVDEHGIVRGVYVDRVPKALKGLEALEAASRAWSRLFSLVGYSGDEARCAVEMPDCSYTHRTGARVSDVGNLSAMSGIVLQASRAWVDDAVLVHPAKWKGQVPKHIHQVRTLTKAGVAYQMRGGASPESQYPVPTGYGQFVKTGKVNEGDWKDINDSIGLAIYARDLWLTEQRRKKWAPCNLSELADRLEA